MRLDFQVGQVSVVFLDGRVQKGTKANRALVVIADGLAPVVHLDTRGHLVRVAGLDGVEQLGQAVFRVRLVIRDTVDIRDGRDTAVPRVHRGILVLPENLDGVDYLVLVVTQALMVFPAIVDIRGSVVLAVLVDIRDQVENPGGLVIVGLMEIRDIAVTLAGLVKVV